MDSTPYSEKELYEQYSRQGFPSEAQETAFPLGGIGTGNISIGSRGEFRDWEIFNRPGKGNKLPYSFFAIRTKELEKKKTECKVLESKIKPPYTRARGFGSEEVGGLPRLDDSVLYGEIPFVNVDFEDDQLPVDVSLEAFSPFIPLQPDDSGIPGAVIRYEVENNSEEAIEVVVTGSLANAAGFERFGPDNQLNFRGKQRNEYRESGPLKGLFFTSSVKSDQPEYGNMALATTCENVTLKQEWYNSSWFDGVQDFWDDLRSDGRLKRESEFKTDQEQFPVWGEIENRPKVGSLGAYKTLKPGDKQNFEFILTWYFPNRIKSWEPDVGKAKKSGSTTIKNYYGKKFNSAWGVGQYLVNDMNRLEGKSREFRRAFFDSTLPKSVIEAAARNITVIRSPTCFRIEDGTFLSWEGCDDEKGCCPGSCTHVWNYAQTLAFLFPGLEQSMRRLEFGEEISESGAIPFRLFKVFDEEWDMLPAADGQLGSVIRLYRDWKISGNNDLLNDLWTKVKKALRYALDHWDDNGDFVLDSQQHTTYNIQFYGENPLTNSLFYAALKAGSEMAEHMEDTAFASTCRKALRKGSKRMDDLLWEESYYVQRLENQDDYRYQFGDGCLSDQLLGQFLAHVSDLGYILPEDHVKQAIKSIYQFNFREEMNDHHCAQRTFALNDEKGLLLCTWPKGGRPRFPFVYCDEVWSGVEYQVATNLIYEGYVEEGLTITKAVRDRHDGYRRNPWDEVECGHHYVRSMASWGLLLGLTGFKYDMVEGKMSFDPRINEDDFQTFWVTGEGWGTYKQWKDPDSGKIEWEIDVLHGKLEDIDINTDT
ncbi:hypothetical protein K9M78_06450 [Candidatus Bipolaricaulota bacterium]|nr:hypothetical protein [Candidatus Bipolaricaulota bacterium]